jgi:N6-adenosine-specific RNA methylase IME4
MWEGLSPPYGTIVADPPWRIERSFGGANWRNGERDRPQLDYGTMSLDEIKALPVGDIAAANAHVYVWTVTAYLHDTADVLKAWGFRPGQLLTWCKPAGGFVGGTFFPNVEWVLTGRRGSAPASEKVNTSWFQWPRGPHSAKPPAFLDMVERVSPGPYVELFARAPRLGWDHWGHGYEIGAAS